ncbi:putative lipid-binding transport protein (Tim44 family) [Neobacillus ginsengisoli]|uniref:Lipid-binding transport protein (Tim44 family) n=1 Tax=Neobacillus ginsengisoli TaxID=904295 RepID=A0ABT9XP56_9BACI|nr:putative lipid-binding transport protein (Tim44 family) [Neobacillus ginsengisoli]
MKNRTSFIIIGGLIILALLGVYGSITANPAGFIQGIAVIALIGLVIYFLVRRFSASSPQKKEQRAFLKAAKQSKKRLQLKSGDSHVKSSSLGTLTSLKKNTKTKKKSPAHLTVIDGKKAKKKNRASF